MKEEFNLFKRSLISFHYGCLKNDAPLNLINPILVQIDFLLNEINYNEKNIERRMELLCQRIEKISESDLHLMAFVMYSICKNIEEKLQYFFIYMDDIIKASEETSLSIEQDNDESYWLTAWQPSRVVKNKQIFIDGIRNANNIWFEFSRDIVNNLYLILFQPPYSNVDVWAILRSNG